MAKYLISVEIDGHNCINKIYQYYIVNEKQLNVLKYLKNFEQNCDGCGQNQCIICALHDVTLNLREYKEIDDKNNWILNFIDKKRVISLRKLLDFVAEYAFDEISDDEIDFDSWRDDLLERERIPINKRENLPIKAVNGGKK